MKKITVIVLFLLFFSPSLFAQSKYLIFFADKGVSESQSLEKSSSIYQMAFESLSKESIDRRKKVLGEDNFILYEDLPINKKYVDNISSLGIEVIYELKWFNAISAFLTDENIQQLSSFSFIKKIEPVRKFVQKEPKISKLYPIANRPIKSAQSDSLDYGLSEKQLLLSDIPQVHAMGFTGENVRIGLLDTGFKWKNNSGLQGVKVLYERDFVFNDLITENEDEDHSNQHDHGTFVLSVIGSQLKSEVIGAAYNSDFLLAKTEYIPTETHTEEDNYAAALEWMEALGVDIISSSLGYSEFDADQISYLISEMDGKTTIVTQAAELAFRFGVLTISSAGNEGDDAWKIITAPADGFNTLAIGAVNSNGEVTGFSGRGPTADGRIKPDIMAMGSSVVGLNPASGIIQGNGTSLSAPIAAGVAALLYEAFPHLNNQQARAILLESGDRVNNPDNDYGYGNVSAMKAIAYPNLEKIGNEFKLNKRFENHDQIESESVEIIYSINGVVENNKKMTIMSDNSYSFTFPQFQGGDSISFRINYLNDAQEIQTEPKTGYYRFIYGKKIIYNLLSTTEEEYPQDDTITVNSVSNVFPNPFMPSIYTNAKFEVNLKNESSISGEIFNLLGQSVWRFAKSGLESGTHLILWNGLNNSGTKIGSGVYLYRFQIGNESFEGKLVVIR